MDLKFPKRVQADLDAILEIYRQVSSRLRDDFYAEFTLAVSKAARQPRFFHFDSSGLRRCNLERFPYHFLYDICDDHIRVWVLRHNRRDPSLGLKRFKR